MGRVLVIEDEQDQCELLEFSLRRSGHQVKAVQTGTDAIGKVSEFNPEVIIMDVMLPDTNGFDLCKTIKNHTRAPVILFSAVRVSEEDRVRGLTQGAQDYLTKSHSHRELLARVQNLLAVKPEATVITTNSGNQALHIYLAEQRVIWGVQELHLTATEFRLLVLLARHQGKVVSYKDMGLALWNTPMSDSTLIKSSFSRLKAKFKPANGEVIFRTVNRQGYALAMSPVQSSSSSALLSLKL